MRAKTLSALFLMTVVQTVTAPARAQPVSPATNPAATAGDEICPAVVLDSCPLRTAVDALAKQAKLNIILDPALLKLADPNVSVSWKNVTARQALQALLDNYGWQMTQSSGSIARISARDPNAVDARRKMVVFRENEPPSATLLDVVTFDGVPLPDAIRALASQASLNIIFDPALAAQKDAGGALLWSTGVTKKWKDITARQALVELLDMAGLQMTRITGSPIFAIAAKAP